MKSRFLKRLRERTRAFLDVNRRIIRWGLRLLLLVALLDIGYLIAIWPDWGDYAAGAIPKSRFIANYEQARQRDPSLPRLQWKPVGYWQISSDMRRAVLVAEDSRFFIHKGIDTEAFREAMEANWEKKEFRYGGSTISQQTAKNLFLSGSRNPLRKLNELVLTFAMEHNLKKRRILELYLNIAEFGPGVYGVEAAAQRYFGVSAAELTLNQAVELAATLPSPRANNPHTRTRFFMEKRRIILRNLGY